MIRKTERWRWFDSVGLKKVASVHLDSVYNINAPEPGPGSPARRRPLRNIPPRVVNVTWADTTGVSNYHSLQIAGERGCLGGGFARPFQECNFLHA